MLKRIKFTVNHVKTADTYLDYEDEKYCPICKASISPVYIASSFESAEQASIFNYCRNCGNSFVTKYQLIHNPTMSALNYYVVEKIVYSEPNRFVRHVFDDEIISLSSQFDKIYNQALAAESSSLDEIAGLGYRKALEFLIKDFAIHENPDDAKSIKSMPLSQCIKKYIYDDRIKTLAERSAWIGNDEAHYVRKQEDRDVSDMKSFIRATVYFISMVLITEDAASMTPK